MMLSSAFLLHLQLIESPDVLHVLFDGTVGGELAGVCGVEDRGSRPPCFVLVLRDGTLLCVVVGLEVLQDEVTVCDVGLLGVQK